MRFRLYALRYFDRFTWTLWLIPQYCAYLNLDFQYILAAFYYNLRWFCSQSAFRLCAYHMISSCCRGNCRNSHLLWPFVVCKQIQMCATCVVWCWCYGVLCVQRSVVRQFWPLPNLFAPVTSRAPCGWGENGCRSRTFQIFSVECFKWSLYQTKQQ